MPVDPPSDGRVTATPYLLPIVVRQWCVMFGKAHVPHLSRPPSVGLEMETVKNPSTRNATRWRLWQVERMYQWRVKSPSVGTSKVIIVIYGHQPASSEIDGNSNCTYWIFITLSDTADTDSATTTILVRGHAIAQHAIVSLSDKRKVFALSRLSGHFTVYQTVPSAAIPRPPTAGKTATALPCQLPPGLCYCVLTPL